MRPSSALSADGPLNLYNAILLASRREAWGLGVLVMLNDCVHAARFVTKTNTTQVETFKSAGHGSLVQIVNAQTGRAHVLTAVTTVHLVSSRLLDNKKEKTT